MRMTCRPQTAGPPPPARRLLRACERCARGPPGADLITAAIARGPTAARHARRVRGRSAPPLLSGAKSHSGRNPGGTLNVYEIVTTRIMDQLQQGTIPWRKPWRTSTAEPRNLISGKAYRGINI